MGLLAIAVGWTAAAFVFAANPRQLANRSLALVLVAESTGVGIARGVDALFPDDPAIWANGLAGVVTSVETLAIVSYLLFLSTLDSPLVRPLRPRPVRIGLVCAAVAWWAFVLFGPVAVWPTLYFATFHTFTWTGVFGLVVGASTWWRTPRGSPRRAQARAYAIAFGWRDVAWFGYLNVIYPSWNHLTGPGAQWFFAAFAPSITIVFIALLGYGALKTQLFDIDLRLKWTLRRGTVAAVFVAVFFVVSEGAQQFFTGTRLGPWMGLAASGLLVFALAPLQRAADRISDRAMPHVHDTDEYRLVRKREVYRAAVDGALQDGAITERERDILARLQDQLGLSGTDARTIEREATATRTQEVA